MSDIKRTLSSLQNIYADNTNGNISPNDLRDGFKTVVGSMNINSVSANLTAGPDDIVFDVNTNSGDITITLPSPNGSDGTGDTYEQKVYYILNNGSNNVILSGSSFTVSSNETLGIISNGTDWLKISYPGSQTLQQVTELENSTDIGVLLDELSVNSFNPNFSNDSELFTQAGSDAPSSDWGSSVSQITGYAGQGAQFTGGSIISTTGVSENVQGFFGASFWLRVDTGGIQGGNDILLMHKDPITGNNHRFFHYNNQLCMAAEDGGFPKNWVIQSVGTFSGLGGQGWVHVFGYMYMDGSDYNLYINGVQQTNKSFTQSLPNVNNLYTERAIGGNTNGLEIISGISISNLYTSVDTNFVGELNTYLNGGGLIDDLLLYSQGGDLKGKDNGLPFNLKHDLQSVLEHGNTSTEDMRLNGGTLTVDNLPTTNGTTTGIVAHDSSGKLITSTLDSDVSTNTSNISTNTSNISTNSSNIVTLDNKIDAVVKGLDYQGTWDASTNTPTLASSVGVEGQYYIVGTAGSTSLNGITDWNVGDWVLWSEQASEWQQVDNTAFESVTNQGTGAEIFKQIVNGTEVQFKTLTDGSKITFIENTNDIELNDSALISHVNTLTSGTSAMTTPALEGSIIVKNTDGSFTALDNVSGPQFRWDSANSKFVWDATLDFAGSHSYKNGSTVYFLDGSNLQDAYIDNAAGTALTMSSNNGLELLADDNVYISAVTTGKK